MVATGRLAVGFEDIRYGAVSFLADNSTIVFDETKPQGAAATMIGKAVTFGVAADTVALAADGDAVIGKLLKVEKDGVCTVQVRGAATLPAGTAATVTPGRKQVGALLVAAKGYIRDVLAATAAEQARSGPMAWDAADLNNVIVDFGG